MQGLDGLLGVVDASHDRDADLGGRDHLDVDARVRQRARGRGRRVDAISTQAALQIVRGALARGLPGAVGPRLPAGTPNLLGAVALNAMPGDRQWLQNEAQRIALLLQMAQRPAAGSPGRALRGPGGAR